VVVEAFARKDRATLHLAEDQLSAALMMALRAEKLFATVESAEGMAHVRRRLGMIDARRGRFLEAKQALRAALDHFSRAGEQAERTRTQWELARIAQAAGEPRPLVTREYLAALALTESCHRAELVRAIGEELKAANPEACYAHVFRRVRGRGAPEETDSLLSGTSEPLTVLFLDIKDSTPYALDTPPEALMITLNQMMAGMGTTLRAQGGRVSSFRGDGFMAIFRGQHYAQRAVLTPLEVCRQLRDFNEPRAILDFRPFAIRVGLSTGAAVLGNVGTYELIDYTAIGATVNLGARVDSEAKPGLPCVHHHTYLELRDRFLYTPDSPRKVVLKGLEELGEQQVWDVVARASSLEAG
jgi:class 3 adenylate cyclase